MKLLDELNNTKARHLALKQQYKKTVDAIKKQNKESHYVRLEDCFRNAVCLYYGEFVGRYSIGYLPNKLELSLATRWDDNNKTQQSLNYYNLRKVFGNIPNKTYENVGFVCELKYLPEVLEYKLKDLWFFHIHENRYTDGLEYFKTQINNKQIDLLKLFIQYHSKNSNIIELMHHPSLKINNIVLFIKDAG